MSTTRLPDRKLRIATAEVSLGRIVGAFGIRGEVKIRSSRIGEDVLRAGIAVALRFASGEKIASRVVRLRRQNSVLIATLEGVSTPERVRELVGTDLIVPRESVQLAEGEYFDEDLVGCRLLEGDRTIGVVRAVLHYPAQDVLELEGGALVPLVGAFVRAIDVAAGIIRVELPPGLVEGEPETA